MFPSIGNAKIFLCRQPTDMRKSYDTLAALTSSAIGEDPLSGALFVFMNRPRNRIKILYYESGGYCLWMKRLEAGSFPLPSGDGKKTADRQGNIGNAVGWSKNRKNEEIFSSKQMIKIGEDITEQLAVEPPNFYVNKYIRPKYASPNRRKGAKVGVKSAPLPDSPIERCKADVSLLASIIVNKYADHLPLYRQEQIFKRHGIKIPANTMCDWVNNCAKTLKPLYNELKNSVLSHDYIHMDETPIDLLRKGKKKRQARLWVGQTGSGPPGIFFHFTESWENKHAKDLLKTFSGTLQTDGCSGYEKVGKRPDITLLFCLAHVRRKFRDAAKLGNKNAEYFVMLTNILYRIEHRIAALPDTISDDGKLALRQKRANRVIDRFIKKLNTTNALPKSALGKAITYAQNRKSIMRNYLQELRFKIDNNAAENSIRPITLGQRNYLFVGSERGGETAAILMSLISTCKANKINPYEYLKDILSKINSYPHKHIENLLPQNWQDDKK